MRIKSMLATGIVIFVLSAVFAAVLAYIYNISPAFIFVFLLSEAVAVFIITLVISAVNHVAQVEAIRNAIDGNFTAAENVEVDKETSEIIGRIRKEKEDLDGKIILERADIDSLIKSAEMIRAALITENETAERIRKDTINIRNYLGTNLKIFDKIRAIGFEIKNTSKGIDQEAQNVLLNAKKQSTVAADGVKAVGREIRSISELKESVTHSAALISELMEMSKRIKGFVSSIAEIAKRTNLLALNAGIEAARAGESGKSFSVVADEIKGLSMNSNKSAEEIAQILGEIQVRTTEVIEMIKTTEKIEENIRTFYMAGDTFIEIVKDVKKIEKLIGNITNYTAEHFTDSDLLYKIINDISKRVEDYKKIVDGIEGGLNDFSKTNIEINMGLENLIAALKSRKPKEVENG